MDLDKEIAKLIQKYPKDKSLTAAEQKQADADIKAFNAMVKADNDRMMKKASDEMNKMIANDPVLTSYFAEHPRYNQRRY